MNKKLNTHLITGINQDAVSLIPQLSGTLAIVDLDVLQRICSFLPKANLEEIKERIIEQIKDAYDLKAYVKLLAREVAFHQTVNILTEYEPEQVNWPQTIKNVKVVEDREMS